MADPADDSPHVAVFPPLLYGSALAAGFLLQWLLPVHPFPAAVARAAGAFLVVLGAGVNVWGAVTMRRAGTNLNPRQPTLAIVTAGPFRLSRNPLYLSLAGLYAGIAVLANALWPLVLLPIVLVVVRYGIIEREERYLEAKFGDTYRAYRDQVRRWL